MGKEYLRFRVLYSDANQIPKLCRTNNLQKFIKSLFKITLIIIVTIGIIEIILQITFLSLPQAIIQRMPQYQERYGIQFETPHGAREYPANEHVDFEINQFSGDLYQISCLSPKDAISIDPYQVTYTRDTHGFRNTEPWEDDIDIAIIGDSFTAAESIQNPYWSDLADSMLVLGLPGSGTLEQKLLLDYFALSRQPETVILAYFGGNDLTDNLTFYNLEQDNLSFADKTHQNRTLLDYLVTVHLALFVRDTLSQSANSDCQYPIEAQSQPPTPLAFYDGMASLLTITEDDLQNTESYKVTQSTIIGIAESVKQSGGEFVLLYIPQKAEVYWQYLDAETKQKIIASLPVSQLIEQPQATETAIDANLLAQRNLLQHLATEADFQMLDLTPFLIDAVDRGQSPYFFADTHWNQIGHDIVHQILVDFLSQSTLDKNRDS